MVELDLYQSAGVGVIALLLGLLFTDRIPFLKRYCIPAPVSGGLLLSLVKNPLVIGAAAGLAANLLRVPCPAVIRTPLDYLAQLAVPLSLLCIGTALDVSRVRRSFGLAAGAAFVKTFAMAAVMLPIAVWLGFRGTELAVIGFYFLLANPSGCYVMTLAMGGDADLTASATVLSTFFSADAGSHLIVPGRRAAPEDVFGGGPLFM